MSKRTSTAAVLTEALAVVAVGAGFAFLANQISPRGLSLSRNYFPKIAVATNQPVTVTPPLPVAVTSTNEDSEEAQTEQRIKDKGLQPLDRAHTEALFHDPRYQQGLIIFIDARNGTEYTDGHIPGAYPLDRFHPDKDLAADLTPCANAEMVVVYCHSSECEDAEYTALMLKDAGVPSQKIFVYGGGFDDWSGHHLPLEEGARNSGAAPTDSK